MKSFTHGGKGRAICLFYDDQVGHYEWIDGDVLDELMFWATPHQGTRLQGGGKRSHVSADGSIRLADFASVTSSTGDVPKTAVSGSMCFRNFASPERSGTNTRQAESVRDCGILHRNLLPKRVTRSRGQALGPLRRLRCVTLRRRILPSHWRLSAGVSEQRPTSWISLAAHCGGRDDPNTRCGTAGPPQGPGSCGSRSSRPVVGVSDGAFSASADACRGPHAEMDGDAIPPPPKPKQHYFKRGTAFLKKKDYWSAPCPHCDAEIAASRPEKVSQQRQTHLRRWHPGLPRMGYHTKTPPPEEVLPEGVPWTVAWLASATKGRPIRPKPCSKSQISIVRLCIPEFLRKHTESSKSVHTRPPGQATV